MPIDSKGDYFDRECPSCGHHGMTKTQVPAPGGPKTVYRCPDCRSIDDGSDDDFAFFVSKK